MNFVRTVSWVLHCTILSPYILYINLERFSTEYRKIETKQITYQLDYSASQSVVKPKPKSLPYMAKYRSIRLLQNRPPSRF